MPTPSLLTQLTQAMSQSPIFNVLPAEKQAELQAAFASASDEQVQAAIAQIAITDEEAAKNAQARGESEQRVVDATQNLKTGIAEFQREELKEDEAAEAVDSQKVAADLLLSLAKGDDGAPKKRAKFLGLF